MVVLNTVYRNGFIFMFFRIKMFSLWLSIFRFFIHQEQIWSVVRYHLEFFLVYLNIWTNNEFLLFAFAFYQTYYRWTYDGSIVAPKILSFKKLLNATFIIHSFAIFYFFFVSVPRLFPLFNYNSCFELIFCVFAARFLNGFFIN